MEAFRYEHRQQGSMLLSSTAEVVTAARTCSCENLAGTGKKYHRIKQKIDHSEHTAGQSQLQASAGNQHEIDAFE